MRTSSRHIKQRIQWCSIVQPTQVPLPTRRTLKLSSRPFHSWTWAANSLKCNTSSTWRMDPLLCKREKEFQLCKKNALRLWSLRPSVSRTKKPPWLTCRLWSRFARCFSITTQVVQILQSSLRHFARQKRSVRKLRLSETNFPSYANSRNNRGSSATGIEYWVMAGDMELLEWTMQTQTLPLNSMQVSEMRRWA